jgi:PAS domain S-box-containing protein
MPSSLSAFASHEDTQQLLESFIDAVGDYALLLLDRDGHVLSWNRGAARICGYDGGEVIGRSFSCLYPAEAVATGKPERTLASAARDGRHEEIGECIRRDGTRFLANRCSRSARTSTRSSAAS